MSEVEPRRLEERVLVLAPTPRDGDRTQALLAEAGVPCALCADLAGLCRELAAGAGAVVLTEEALSGDGAQCLVEALRPQPAWSDLPILVLTGGGADSPAALLALQTLGNVTLLERPVRVLALVSTVRAALRARRRQYQVRDHLAERERVEAALREGDRRKDEFLAMLAHELRNPMAPVRNGLALLRLQCRGNPALEQLGKMMERQVSHMSRLVDDLLDVSRITRGKIDLRKELVELSAVVARAAEDVRPLLDDRRHHIEVELPPGPLTLEADPARLEQILVNLLSNAAKYTEPGGRIRLSAARQGGEIVVRVEDNGIGIRPEMLGRIFDMFQQADRVPGHLSEGLGLGLTLVRTLAEMHGGTVAATSAGPGRGSAFVVRLPALQEVSETAADGVGPAHGLDGQPLRVLVVDDNVDGAESMALLLRLTGEHEVRVAHDGPAALAVAQQFRPDVVLLDIGLPKGMDGCEVARRLRREVGLAETFLVALTGFGQEEDRRRSQAAGFNAHWVKPVVPEAVQELLARLTGGRQPGSGA